MKGLSAKFQVKKRKMDDSSSVLNKYNARVHELELQNEILEHQEKVQVDEGSDELRQQGKQSTIDNHSNGIPIHDDDDEKDGRSARLVTPSPPSTHEIPGAPWHIKFTDIYSSSGAGAISTAAQSSEDGLTTSLPLGLGMREVEDENKGVEPAEAAVKGLRKEEGELELGTSRRRQAHIWKLSGGVWIPMS